jgi:hypothetical protein|tara:strand:- start:4 stop:348 length:345 start_codon:yes stop_codon:yes gene_type:complete
MPYTNETFPKTEFNSNIKEPAKITVGNKHYVVPLWLEVSSNFNVKRAVRDRLIVNTFDFSVKTTTNEWNITGSTGNDYTVKFNSSGSYSCDCMGFRRAKDGKCKHIKQVIAENC